MSNMSMDTFLAAFQRFVVRRGNISDIYFLTMKRFPPVRPIRWANFDSYSLTKSAIAQNVTFAIDAKFISILYHDELCISVDFGGLSDRCNFWSLKKSFYYDGNWQHFGRRWSNEYLQHRSKCFMQYRLVCRHPRRFFRRTRFF